VAFDDDITDALSDLRSEAGRTVTVRRGATEIAITAVPGTTRSSIETDQGARLEMTVRDFVVRAEDYDFGDGPVLPRPGDEIDDLTETFEVSALADSIPCWEWSDRGHTSLRIHTTER